MTTRGKSIRLTAAQVAVLIDALLQFRESEEELDGRAAQIRVRIAQQILERLVQ